MKTLLVLIFVPSVLFGQRQLFLHLTPKFGSSDLVLNQSYSFIGQGDVKIDHFNYYLSEIAIQHDGGQQLLIYDTVFLIKPDNYVLFLGERNVDIIERIDFTIGVPKNLNTQTGSQAIDISLYPENHPLSFQDPSMYWGWQGGYMHMITGGYVDTDSNGDFETYFELHNLGDNNQQPVGLPVVSTSTSENQRDVYLECHWNQWLSNVPLSLVGSSHGEVGINKTVLENVNQYPVFVQPTAASLTNLEPQIFVSVEPNSVKLELTTEVQTATLSNLSGQILTASIQGNRLEWNKLTTGVYVLHWNNQNAQGSKRIFVP